MFALVAAVWAAACAPGFPVGSLEEGTPGGPYPEATPDGGDAPDSGTPPDAGSPPDDGGIQADAGTPDAGSGFDGGPGADAGTGSDAGTGTDAGTPTPRLGCSFNQVETPIVTNWPTAGDAQAPPMTYTRANGCFYTWGPTFLPGYDDYVTNTYSNLIVSDVDARAIFQSLCQQVGGIPYRVLRPTPDALSRLESSSHRAQVVHGVIAANSFVTIILPPNWRADAPPNSYPIVAQGFYDVNANLFAGFGEGQRIARWVARSGVDGNRGAIGLVWNGGGGISSGTLTAGARAQFNSIVQQIAQFLHGDPNRILLFGGSRGGSTTLALASNPEGHPYRVTYAYAWVPGVKIGTHLRLASPTMPTQAGFGQTGFADAWKPDWRYPSCGRPELVGLTAKEAAARIIIGSYPSVAEIDGNHSPISDRFIAGLAAAGTQLNLAMGSHDSYIPFGTQLEYLEKLQRGGVSVEAQIYVRGGHFGDMVDIESRMWNAIRSYVEPGASPALRTVTANRVSFFRVLRNDANGSLERFTPSNGFPFTFEVPRQQYTAQPLMVFASGPPGTQYEAYVNGTLVVSGQIGATWMNDHTLDVRGFASGAYPFSRVRILKPGSTAWRDLDLRLNTSADGTPLSIRLDASAPADMNDQEAMLFYRENATNLLGTFPFVSWGIADE